MDEITCWRIVATGMVQGLGFRPYIYRLAQDWELKGWVLNSGQGVTIEVQGPETKVSGFYRQLPKKKPSLAQIINLDYELVSLKDYKDFRILDSLSSEQTQVLVLPDLSTCPECRAEVLAEGERYHQYPFTNCTYCGPRFTVIKSLPYDRARTSMAEFKMCPECHTDYHDPGHRRFHAQPTACNFCGPHVTLLDKNGFPVDGYWRDNFHNLIAQGKVFAVKGIGGFHLVCSALNSEAVKNLRLAKRRPYRPFAVMARDMDTVKRYCHVSWEEEALLETPAAPIVILDAIEGTVPEVLAPHNPTLGVMLPYSPLHLLLFNDQVDLLVMTSGNARGLPIVKDNAEALRELAPFVDFFLLHNREIVSRCDDSVVRKISGEMFYYRRSKGYVPSPLELKTGVMEHVLGLGSEMKNTFCLLKEQNAFFSQHIGEMNSLENLDNYRLALNHYQVLFGIKPTIIGYDPHPGSQLYVVLREIVSWTTEHLKKPPLTFPVQHHHAHMASVMAENALEGDVIGAILDGTGYGLDGTLWGFEILTGNYTRFTRFVHLAGVPLPGGENAVRNPWIVATAYLLTHLGQEGKQAVTGLFPRHAQEIDLVERMISEKINSPTASSAGRLFDAVAAILGMCLENTYDGQAAIELGESARRHSRKLSGRGDWLIAPYSFSLHDGVLEVGELLHEIISDLTRINRNHGDASPGNALPGLELPPISIESIAVKFHYTVAAMVIKGVQEAYSATKLKRVVLSGGVWQNPLLLEIVTAVLMNEGFLVFTQQRSPANDGGLALGQAVAAYHMWLEYRSQE